uniref:Uncharacterized protein n=1 Tax=Arundo donax TaxID=35708 RepID=A0A0A9C002_ARUDO
MMCSLSYRLFTWSY